MIFFLDVITLMQLAGYPGKECHMPVKVVHVVLPEYSSAESIWSDSAVAAE